MAAEIALGDEEEAKDRSVTIPHISLAEMNPEVRDFVAARTPIEYFWTDDWSPRFYRAQAKLGFIAVAARGPGDMGNVLMPQLQNSYAVLDWSNLVVERGVRKILSDGRLEREPIKLVVESNPDTVLKWLEIVWGEKSWIGSEYVQLAKTLATDAEQLADPGFRLLATTLFSAGEPVAGELGYAVGRVYVSLSGFFRRERPEWNNYGKLQMVLLARHLNDAGFRFWNLGHPHMDYKRRLGAEILPRVRFLARWDKAAAGEVPAGFSTISRGP